MSKIDLIFFNGKVDSIPARKLKFLTYGGQGKLFSFIYEQKNFLLKALPDDNTAFRRLSAFYQTLRDRHKKIPDVLWYRGFPLAHGHCEGELLDFNNVKDVYFFVYNFLNGRTLYQELRVDPTEILEMNTIPQFHKRKNLCLKVLENLVLLEKSGVVHNDLKPENFMIRMRDKNVYILDLEGGGLWDKIERQWIMKPAARSDSAPWPKPPESQKNPEGSSFTDRWFGANLIWWILTGTDHPFLFMKRIDKSALDNLYSSVRQKLSKGSWPPMLNDEFIMHREDYSIKEFSKLIKKYFTPSFEHALFESFIIGYINPQRRTTFTEWNKIVNFLP